MVPTPEANFKVILIKIFGNDQVIKGTIKINDECSESVNDIFLDLEKLEENYPDLQGIRRKDIVTNKCFYPGYSSVNSIIRFNRHFNPKILAKPESCHFADSTRTSIIFGIKTMPQSTVAREIIRQTWLREDIWEWLGVQIKVVFLVGSWGRQLASSL
ncbi:Oidioi.mRNA.OKI2018_I69.chr1.g2.t2.cds [Oikopleura dioica]|uniref:Oidioi.mRNA.OKI2018_I69.chr1.g2.t2.cds n=1 Tax=Oikopleura dioica TaxID=34765 RepID=A0ABN7SMA8_OIKDI|nr:Oidioi.mRNA.OKI2018_I69.chr1.g2.t2.cds [Oikopleura dioica]